MDIKSIFSNKEDCALAARISALTGIAASLAGVTMSLIAIVKKKQGKTVSKGFKAVSCVFTVFAVAGALLGTLLSDKALEEE